MKIRKCWQWRGRASAAELSTRSVVPALLALAYCAVGCSSATTDQGLDSSEVAKSVSSIVNVDNAYLPYGARSNWTGGAFFGSHGTFFADVTGDGQADAISSIASGLYVRRSVGTSFTPNETWSNVEFVGGAGVYFADVTGDGAADAIASWANGLFVRRSTGSVFNPTNEQWTTVDCWGPNGTYFADVDGDGRADAITGLSDSVVVRLANTAGTGFGAPTAWSTIAFVGSRGTFFADVTGDGKADAIAVTDFGIYVRRSTGSAFAPNENWASDAFYGFGNTFVVDATGDGKADVIAVNDDAVYMRRSNGFQFGSTELAADQVGLAGPRAAADVNGDKRADFLEVTANGVQVAASRERVIPIRFVQFTANGVANVSNAQLDNAIATANAIFYQLNLRFTRAASHLVQSATLAALSDTVPTIADNLSKAKDAFNSPCLIGNVSGQPSELAQLKLVGTRCALPGEVLVYVTNTAGGGSESSYPNQGNSIVMSVGNIVDDNATNMLFAHELGHYLGLPHVWEAGFGVTDFQTGISSKATLWDLVYKPVGNSWISFRSRAEAEAVASSLVSIQAPGSGGWWCPSGNASEPCPASAPLGLFVLPVKDGNNVTHNVSSGNELLKGLAPTLPGGLGSFNVMSYNNTGNPSNIQQRTPGLSLSQIEQVRKVLTYNTSTGVLSASGVPIPGNRPLLGR